MAWHEDHLTPADRLLFQSDLVKVGRFCCQPHEAGFGCTPSLDNDVFALARNPLWIRRDSGRFHYVEAGGVVVHRSGTTLERKDSAGLGDHSIWFGIHPELFAESLDRHLAGGQPTNGAILASPLMRCHLLTLIEAVESGETDRLAIEETVLAHFENVCVRQARRLEGRKSSRPGTGSRRCRLVDRARDFLDEHLAESVGLSVVARAAGASVFHLCRVFREETGLSLHTYRTWQRLGKAAERIVETSPDCLTGLALDLGFSSHSHMSRQFRKHLGVAPSVLRQNRHAVHGALEAGAR